ncbi:tetratricopeptide repeat protein 36 [Heteronotia binoei]|uniref:tetratricopeptide repeat protein 36 n=1 Tax=Heteronotia binoei TaxID=13085 RepID=UPI00292DA7E5|nr:tetratricopeptide repeat protein 36 [Heteronotia binoei]
MGSAEEARAVLQSLFHPHLPLGEGPDEEEEEGEGEEEPLQGEAFAPDVLEEARALELQGIAAAEAGDPEAALESFSRAIQLLPARASPYNNRAQARRLQGDVEGALADLAAALERSAGTGRAGRQALVQRGLIRRLQGDDEAARQDFAQAARLGSPFARRQLLLLNPYAALCNHMLAAALRKLRGPPDAAP